MRVTELRVHGVGGAAPDALLGTPAHQQVWGDRIAGFYTAEADRRGRAVEAYCWGGMTSRSSTRVLWLLLFPFMLANLAGWTCSARTAAYRPAFTAHRVWGRLAALAITLNLLLISAMAAMDIWAYQFGGAPPPKSAPAWKAITHKLVYGLEQGPRLVVGASVVAATLLALLLLSWQARNRYEEVTPTEMEGKRPSFCAAALPDGVGDPGFFDGAATVRRLGHLHVSAGLAWLAFVLAYLAGSGKVGGAPWPAQALQAGAVALFGCAIVLLSCVAAVDRLVLPLLAATSLLAALAAAYTWTSDLVEYDKGHPAGLREAAIGTLTLIVTLIFARVPVMALIALFRMAAARRGTALPRPADRWPAAPLTVAVLGMLSLNIAGLGCLFAIAKALGSQGGVFPAIGSAIPWLILTPVALIAVFVLVELIRYGWAGYGPAVTAVEAEYAGRAAATPAPTPPWDTWRCSALPDKDNCAGERQRRMRWVRSIARGRKLAGFPCDLRYLFAGLLLIGILILAYTGFQIGQDDTHLTGRLGKFALTVAALIPVAGVALLRWGWGRPDARRLLGVLWDVGTFWPRSYHPFAPPCYAERAVPDLQRRIRWLHDHGDRVVVVAHSQGSILAAVALAQQPEAQPALVTFGSPLMKLYGWAFPAYINDALLDRLRIWRNFSYLTDYIGGPVGRPEVDVVLPDPQSAWYTAGEPMPRIRRHTGYWSDDAMWKEIDRLAAEPLRTSVAA